MSATDTEDGDFDFEPGDSVLVRVRENGDSGPIVAKFEAECRSIDGFDGLLGHRARFDMDWGLATSVTLRPYEAEFEVLD